MNRMRSYYRFTIIIPTFWSKLPNLITILISLILLQICLTSATQNGSKTEITIRAAILIPQSNYIFSWDRMEPVFALAVESITNLYPNFHMNLHYEDDECSESLSPFKAAYHYYQNKINVIFGPMCNHPLVPVARFATIWKIPLLTPGALVDAFDVKTGYGYSTVTRLTGSYSHVGLFVQEIFRNFEWKPNSFSYIDIYVEQNSDTVTKGKSEEYFICSGIYRKLKLNGFEMKSRIFQTVEDLRNLLLTTKEESRGTLKS